MKITISTRLVILTRRHALKIPLDYRGWLQGKNEVKLWAKYGHRKLLAPVIWHWGGVVKMKRVQPLHVWCRHWVDDVKKEVPELRIHRCDLNKVENWGQMDGHPVLLDYGITEQVAAMY